MIKKKTIWNRVQLWSIRALTIWHNWPTLSVSPQMELASGRAGLVPKSFIFSRAGSVGPEPVLLNSRELTYYPCGLTDSTGPGQFWQIVSAKIFRRITQWFESKSKTFNFDFDYLKFFFTQSWASKLIPFRFSTRCSTAHAVWQTKH